MRSGGLGAGWLVLFAGLASSCDGDSEAAAAAEACDDASGASVIVGTGQTEFEPLVDGDGLEFVFGPQGGYHVFVSIQAIDVVPGTGSLENPDDPVVTVGVDTESGEALSSFDGLRRGFVDNEEGMALIGQLVVLDHPDPPSFDGVSATLSVEVVDRCGQVATDQRSVVLTLAP